MVGMEQTETITTRPGGRALTEQEMRDALINGVPDYGEYIREAMLDQLLAQAFARGMKAHL